MWASAVSAAKHYDATPVTCPSNGTRNTYGGRWAGYEIPATANSSPGYTGTISEWKVPVVSANAGYPVGDCTYLNGSLGAPTVSVWSGTGSANGTTTIIQAGTDSCSAATPTYRFWNEDYPTNDVVFEGPAITGGNTAYVETGYEGGTECLFYEENVTTGHYSTYTDNNCTAHSEAYAEFIIERDNNLSLPSFSTFSQSGVYSSNTTNYYLDKQAGTKAVMTTNCKSTGTVMSSPGAVTSSNNFPQAFYKSSPVCNTG